MKKFKEIYLKEVMEMPNISGISRVQRFNSDESVEFELDDESRVFLKSNLPLTSKIYEPTLKKLAENIIILNRQKHRKTDVSRDVYKRQDVRHMMLLLFESSEQFLQ